MKQGVEKRKRKEERLGNVELGIFLAFLKWWPYARSYAKNSSYFISFNPPNNIRGWNYNHLTEVLKDWELGGVSEEVAQCPSRVSLTTLCDVAFIPSSPAPTTHIMSKTPRKGWNRQFSLLGAPRPPRALCQQINLLYPSYSGTEPRAGSADTWPHPSPTQKSWEITLSVPILAATFCIYGWTRDKSVWPRYSASWVKGFRSHWWIILQANATGLLSDWTALKVSVSRSDPKNRFSDASRGGSVCGCHTPHGPVPLDPARPSTHR
jgi:hypothetical protein